MLLFQDGSTHRWLPGTEMQQDLIDTVESVWSGGQEEPTQLGRGLPHPGTRQIHHRFRGVVLVGIAQGRRLHRRPMD
jgi:hypothetical protein